MPCSLMVGTSGREARRFSVSGSDDPQIPRAYLLARLLRFDHHHLHVTAEQIRESLAAAGKRNEGPLRSGCFLDQ